jgi:hypothetical protein
MVDTPDVSSSMTFEVDKLLGVQLHHHGTAARLSENLKVNLYCNRKSYTDFYFKKFLSGLWIWSRIQNDFSGSGLAKSSGSTTLFADPDPRVPSQRGSMRIRILNTEFCIFFL